MAMSKQMKALYEAALRSKGLMPGRAVRQDPREFVGPIETVKDKVLWRTYSNPKTQFSKSVYYDVDRPKNTYFRKNGRLQDLEDELQAAMDAGIWAPKNRMRNQYERYYNGNAAPSWITSWRPYPSYYEDGYNSYRYSVNHYEPRHIPGTYGLKDWYNVRETPRLTRLGELELEAEMDEVIENDYKEYLRKMYEGKIPMQKGYSADDLSEYLDH